MQKKAIVEYKFNLYAHQIIAAVLASAPKEIKDIFAEQKRLHDIPKNRRFTGRHYPNRELDASVDIAIKQRAGNKELEITLKAGAEVTDWRDEGEKNLSNLIDATVSEPIVAVVDTTT